MKTPALFIAALLAMLAACASNAPTTTLTPTDAFFARLAALCGKAYAGRVAVDTPASTNDPFAGKALTMHVRECNDDTIRIPSATIARAPGWYRAAHPACV